MTDLRARAIGLLRRVGAHPRLLPLTALLLRARTVRPALAFVLREGLRRNGPSLYRLRTNGLRIAIRHGTGDVVTLGEVFHEHQYSPIDDVRPMLLDVRRIVDLGANVGLFGAQALARWPAAKIVAFEPDPENAAIHQRTIVANRLVDRWRLIQAAACDRDGRAAFVAGHAALSHLADPGHREATIEVTLVDALPYLAHADLVKMDIEGGEWAILGSPRFPAAPPRVLVLEYHPRLCPGGDPRAEVEAVLTAAGLHLRPIWHRSDGHGMLWAWRS